MKILSNTLITAALLASTPGLAAGVQSMEIEPMTMEVMESSVKKVAFDTHFSLAGKTLSTHDIVSMEKGIHFLLDERTMEPGELPHVAATALTHGRSPLPESHNEKRLYTELSKIPGGKALRNADLKTISSILHHTQEQLLEDPNASMNLMAAEVDILRPLVGLSLQESPLTLSFVTFNQEVIDGLSANMISMVDPKYAELIHAYSDGFMIKHELDHVSPIQTEHVTAWSNRAWGESASKEEKNIEKSKLAFFNEVNADVSPLNNVYTDMLHKNVGTDGIWAFAQALSWSRNGQALMLANHYNQDPSAYPNFLGDTHQSDIAVHAMTALVTNDPQGFLSLSDPQKEALALSVTENLVFHPEINTLLSDDEPHMLEILSVAQREQIATEVANETAKEFNLNAVLPITYAAAPKSVVESLSFAAMPLKNISVDGDINKYMIDPTYYMGEEDSVLKDAVITHYPPHYPGKSTAHIQFETPLKPKVMDFLHAHEANKIAQGHKTVGPVAPGGEVGSEAWVLSSDSIGSVLTDLSFTIKQEKQTTLPLNFERDVLLSMPNISDFAGELNSDASRSQLASVTKQAMGDEAFTSLFGRHDPATPTREVASPNVEQARAVVSPSSMRPSAPQLQ
jgi:hypothetical protein